MVVSLNGGPKNRHPDTSLLIAGTPPKNGTSGLETSHVGTQKFVHPLFLNGCGGCRNHPDSLLGRHSAQVMNGDSWSYK